MKKTSTDVAARPMAACMILIVLMGAVQILLSTLGQSAGVNTRGGETSVRFPLRTDACTVTETAADGYGGVVRTYEFACPEELTKELCIGVYLAHLYADVYIDGTLVYTLREPDEPHLGHTPGVNWTFIPLADEDAGAPVRIVVTPAYRAVAGWDPFVIISGKDHIVALCAAQDGWKIAVSVLSVLSGLLFTAVANMLHFDRSERLGMLYVGLFAVCYGLAFMMELPLVALAIRGQGRLLTYIAMTAFSVTPLVMMRAVAWDRPGTWSYEILSMVEVGLCLVVFAAQLMDAHDMREALLCERILAGVCLVVIAVRSAIDLARNINGARRRTGAWFGIILALCGVTDIVTALRKGVGFDAVLTLIVVLCYCVLRGTQIIRDAFRRQERLRAAEEALAEQRTAMLMSQIRPHFIYNTMNSIYSLCDTDPEQAKRAIHSFSRYLRMNFESFSARRPVSIVTELRHVRFYLSIEQLRFGQELSVDYDIACDSFRLPAITLQPLVENAVLHGVRRKVGAGRIALSTWEAEDAYYVLVEDDGAGFDMGSASADERRFHGLENVRSRLDRMCGGTLTIRSAAGRGTQAEIRLPKRFAGGSMAGTDPQGVHDYYRGAV